MDRIRVYWVRLLRVLTFGTIVMWAISLVAFFQVIGKPFPGFVVEPPLVISSVHSREWESHKAGAGYFDHLLTADGKPLATVDDLDRLVASVPVGTPITYEYLHGNEKRSMTVRTRLMSMRDMVGVMLLWVLVGSVYLLVGTVAFWLKPQLPAAQAHLVLCLAMSLTLNGQVPFFLQHRFGFPLLQSLSFMGAGYLHLALTFPRVPGFVQRRPYLIAIIAYVPAIVLAVAITLFYKPAGLLGDRAAHDFYTFFVQVLYGAWSVLGMLSFLVAVLLATLRTSTPVARQQAGIVLIGTALTVISTILSYFLPVSSGTPGPLASTVEIIGLGILPVSIAYAILRHQLFDIQTILRRATLYTALALAVAGLYLAIATAGYALASHFLLGSDFSQTVGFLAALTAAVAFHPLHQALRRLVDRMFLGERLVPTAVLASFPKSPLTDPAAVAGELVRLIQGAFHASWVRVTITGGLELAMGSEPGAAGNAELQVALTSSHGSEGQILVGPKGTEMPYTAEEQQALNVLADHAATALLTARLANQQVQMRVQEASALAVAAERESALLAVDRQLRQELHVIKAAVDDVADGRPDVPFAGVNDSLGRISDYLDGMVPWVKAADTEVGTV